MSKHGITLAHCKIETNVAGMACPLCRVVLQPGVGHLCYQPETAGRPVMAKRKLPWK